MCLEAGALPGEALLWKRQAASLAGAWTCFDVGLTWLAQDGRGHCLACLELLEHPSAHHSAAVEGLCLLCLHVAGAAVPR